MIEIILLSRLVKSIGAIVRGKGRIAFGYQLLTVLLWLGGEIAGLAFGFSHDMGNGSYALGLIGAATGAALSYTLASVVPTTRRGAQMDAIDQVFE